ncbi:MAG: hypothetical protein V3T42_11400 [Nitrospirales bacterium]
MLDLASMQALYYPFHLCHELTLQRLLTDYQSIHFRDFMALQLTPMMGTTAFPDRMGDYYPQVLEAGRIVQGYNVSGPLSPEFLTAIDRDLADPAWRSEFHEGLTTDPRFQRGLVAFSQDSEEGNFAVINSAALCDLQKPTWLKTSFTTGMVQGLGGKRLLGEEEIRYEYGWALIKTSASLAYTIQLCHQHHLVAATDSQHHHQLLAKTCLRESINLPNVHVKREGY